MFLLKIINKSSFHCNIITKNYIKHLLNKIKILELVEKETVSFYLNWWKTLIIIKYHAFSKKTSSFISYIYDWFYNSQKLINYIINIKLSSTNTFINVNTIKGNPRFFYSAGMFKYQKKQKIKQPKVIVTILRALLLKSRIFRIKPVALHFNNVFPNQQSYIFKRLKQKTFIKLITSYSYQPHNGCRLRKKKRIKVRTRTKKSKKEWLSG